MVKYLGMKKCSKNNNLEGRNVLYNYSVIYIKIILGGKRHDRR